MTVNIEVDVLKYGNQQADNLLRKFAKYKTGPNTLTVKGTFEEGEEFFQEFRQAIGQPTTNTNSVFEQTNSNQTMRVPLFQYWYLNHMCRSEIESIQQKHGVKIKADVCVSVELSGASSKSSTDACQEFQDLFYKYTTDLDGLTVPSVIELVKDIQTFDAKLMLYGSAQNWSLVGPRDQVDAIKRNQKNDLKDDANKSERGHWDRPQNQNPHGESRWGAPKDIEMKIKDTVLNDGIRIHNTHWDIMKNAFKKQIKDLENKFGVEFPVTNIHDHVVVKVQSTAKQFVNLEVNAIRALMSLYQKVVMNTMCCPLQNAFFDQADTVKKYLSDVREQNPSLIIGDGSFISGVWMLIGLSDHLRFAVREIEKRFNMPIFDEKHKDMISYEKNTEFLRPFTDGTTGGRVDLGEGASWTSEIEARGQRASGSSVDGPVRSDLEEEDGQKTGGTGRKGTSGFGNHKEWEKEAGASGQNGDHRALPGGADGGGTSEEDNCPICMDEFINKEKLPCGHGFCKDCLRRSFESMGASCPVCKKIFGKVEGDQPDGKMTDYIQRSSLPGFKRCDTIVINYNIPSGIQSSKHPKPGRPFQGAQRTAYLPDNKEGREVLALLKMAFDQRLIFTVGTSRTSGMDDCVTWNDVHHKTNIHGGAQNFGYPDDDYLKRVRDELKAKGIE